MDAVAWKNVVFLGLSFPVSLNVPLVPVFAEAARLSAVVCLVYLVGMVLVWFAPETRGQPLPE